MTFILLSILALCACFAACQVYKKARIRNFLKGMISLYFRHQSQKDGNIPEVFHRVIKSRYSRYSDSRNLRHVQNLWNEYLEEQKNLREGGATEKEQLLKLICIVSLVEKQEFLRAKEESRNSLFEDYFSAFSPAKSDTGGGDGQAA